MVTDTEALIVRARQGDETAVGALVRRCLPMLRAYVRLKSSDALRLRESCSDLVQVVLFEAMRHLGDFEYRGEGSFHRWLSVWAMNTIANRERHHRRARRDVRREVPMHDAETQTRLLDCYATITTPTGHAVAQERLAQIEAAFDRLPPRYRDVILQARLLGMSHAEIARDSGRSEGAVRVLLSRGLSRLAILLDESRSGPPRPEA